MLALLSCCCSSLNPIPSPSHPPHLLPYPIPSQSVHFSLSITAADSLFRSHHFLNGGNDVKGPATVPYAAAPGNLSSTGGEEEEDEEEYSSAAKCSGTSARRRRLLRVREEKRKREFDRLHNYPTWAKILEKACKDDEELRAVLGDSIGNPELMRKKVEERVRKKGRDFRKSKTGSVLAFKVIFRE